MTKGSVIAWQVQVVVCGRPLCYDRMPIQYHGLLGTLSMQAPWLGRALVTSKVCIFWAVSRQNLLAAVMVDQE